MKPNILIIGPSGTGKSSSLRNCDPTKTAILNTEQKALPFRGAAKFKMNRPVSGMENEGTKEAPKMVASMNPYWDLFKKMMKGKNSEVLVVESLTSLLEQQMRATRRFFTGFDLWGNYEIEIAKILHEAKNTDKYIAMIGIDGVLEGANGVEERYFAVQGKWKKMVEKEFVIVLFTTCIIDDEGNAQYKFVTNKQKGFENCSAKSPMGMLPPIMDNDLAEVIKLSEAFYNGEEEAPAK
jgi:hypothetical protein